MATSTAAKRIEAFYTRRGDSGVPVSLWLGDGASESAPRLDGLIGDRRVIVFLRNGDRGRFLSIKGSKRLADGLLENLGTGNMVVNSRGIPKLVIKMDGHEGSIWAEVSKRAPDQFLTDAGLNMESMAAKKVLFEASNAPATA